MYLFRLKTEVAEVSYNFLNPHYTGRSMELKEFEGIKIGT